MNREEYLEDKKNRKLQDFGIENPVKKKVMDENKRFAEEKELQ